MKIDMSGYEKAGRILSIWGWLYLLVMLLFYIGVISDMDAQDEPDFYMFSNIFFIAQILIGLFTLFLAARLKYKKPNIVLLSYIVSIYSVLFFPIGTVLGCIVLYYLISERGYKKSETGV